MKKIITLLAVLLLCAALPAYAQVVLVGNFGQGAEMLSYGEEGDGAYSQTLLVDAGVLITTGRERLEGGDNDTLDSVLARDYPEAYDIALMDMPPVAGYAAQRVRFYLGDNEDTHAVDYVYIPADEWLFFAEFDVPADWLGDYEDLVEAWIASIDLFDDGLDGTEEPEGDPELEPDEDAAPLSWEDLSTYVILTDDEDTVADLAEMFAPERYTWHTDPESGDMRLTLVCESGLLTIEPDIVEGLTAEAGEAGALDLPEAVLFGGCDFVEAEWLDADFPLYPLRSLNVGDPLDAVPAAYDGGEPFTPNGEDADAAIAYSVQADAPERGEAVLTYLAREGAIVRIRLEWFADE